MALPSAGNPISFKDINEEIGNTGNAELDLKTAGETFGDTEPFGMDELLGQSHDTPQFTTGLSATADTVDPSKVVLAWAVGVPSGAPAISAFTLKRATDSNITQNVSTLSTNAAGSPVNDTGLAGGTQFFYRASATNAIGTTVSNANATTVAARTSIATKHLRQVEQGESDLFIGWVSNPSLSHLSKGELVLCAEGVALPDDGNIEFSLVSETDFIADGTLSNGDTLFAGSTGTSVTDKKPNDDLVNRETFLVDTTQGNIFQINTSGVISNVRSRTPSQPSQPTLNADSGTQITVTIPSTDTSVTREFKLQRSINGGSYSDRATFVPSDSGSIDDTSISTDFVDDSGISAGDVVKYRVRGSNAFEDSPLSTESATVTTPSATSFSASPSSAAILMGSTSTLIGTDPTGDPAFSDAITVSVTNRQGNIDVTRTQNTSGTFTVAAGTSDPGTGGTYLTAVSNINSDTVVVRGRFQEAGKNVSEGPTNNVITLTDDVSGDSISINISCRVTNF
jgi:hypothetical protein